MAHLQDAFDQVCSEAKQPKGAYMALMERRPYYGGPEEGGWWGTDNILCGYQFFETEEAANRAKEAVEKMAVDLTKQAKKEYGQHCADQMDWLEERRLESDFLPEVDGESDFYVTVTEDIPESRMGTRGYS